MSESQTAEKQDTETETVDRTTLFSLLGKAHTLEILNTLVLGDDEPVRFGELKDDLKLSPNTLSRRLDELVEVGFLTRTQYDEIPPRVEYEATEKLEQLEPTFQELEDWMAKYGPENPDCPE